MTTNLCVFTAKEKIIHLPLFGLLKIHATLIVRTPATAYCSIEVL